jgi:uncharacterized membrane protein
MTRLRFVVPMLVGLSFLWCAALVAPPLLHMGESHYSEALVRLVFAPICHQLPERSFAPWGASMAVCARCFGAYTGFLLGAVLVWGVASLRGSLPGSPRRLILLGSILPTAAQWTLSAAGLTPDVASARALTSSVFGIVIAFCILPAIDSLARGWEERRDSSLRGRLNAEPT